MAGVRYPQEIKDAVLKLGTKSAVPYAEIQKRFRIPKSTLSVWFKKAGQKVDRARQLSHLASARNLSVIALRKQRAARIESAVTSARELAGALPMHTKPVGKSLLAMLYWGEGGKTDNNMKFTNTDPVLMSLFVSLLRQHYAIDENRLHVALLVHDYHDQKQTIAFWSRKLHISRSQFWKVYVKPRSGRKKEYRKNFYGICNVHYGSTAIQRELIALGKEIAARTSVRD